MNFSKSLELAFLLPTDPMIDLDFEVAGTEQLATTFREALKHQQFSASVQADARALLNPTNPNADKKPSDAFRFACNADGELSGIMRKTQLFGQPSATCQKRRGTRG